MYEIISEGQKVTESKSFKGSLRRAENARVMGMRYIRIMTPRNVEIPYSN
jgi:hypothetical protein